MQSIIILLTMFLATTLSTMSGGGSSIISLPIFLSLGISFPLSTATQKLSSAFWVLPAAYNYLKDKKIIWPFLISFTLVGLVGSYFGVLFVLSIKQPVVEIIIGFLILFLVIHTYFQKDLGLKENLVHSKFRQFLAYPLALVLGFYEGVFGAGNGIAFAVVSFYTKGFDFIKALGHYFAIAFLWVAFAAILLMNKGYYDFGITVPAIIGSVAGGYVGSKYAKYRGNKFIKALFISIGGILGLKLILQNLFF